MAGLVDEVGRAGGDAVGFGAAGVRGVRLGESWLGRVRLSAVRPSKIRLSGDRSGCGRSWGGWLVGGWSGRVRLGGGRLGRVRLGQVPRSGKTNRMRGHGVFAGKGVSGGRGGAAEIAGMPELGQIYSPPPRASMRSRACHRMLGWRHLATARDCGRQSLCVRVSVLGADCAAGLVRSGPVAVSVHCGLGSSWSRPVTVWVHRGLGPLRFKPVGSTVFLFSRVNLGFVPRI